MVVRKPPGQTLAVQQVNTTCDMGGLATSKGMTLISRWTVSDIGLLYYFISCVFLWSASQLHLVLSHLVPSYGRTAAHREEEEPSIR